jgi:hypothetical protein
VRSIFTAGTVVFLGLVTSGCFVTLPKVAANGKYSQIYFQGMPILEIEYPDGQSCASDSNRTDGLNLDARRVLSDGTIRIECSPSALGEVLRHRFQISVIITGKTYPARSVSYDSCIFLAKANALQALKYNC